jgi:hypothetical protein
MDISVMGTAVSIAPHQIPHLLIEQSRCNQHGHATVIERLILLLISGHPGNLSHFHASHGQCMVIINDSDFHHVSHRLREILPLQ